VLILSHYLLNFTFIHMFIDTDFFYGANSEDFSNFIIPPCVKTKKEKIVFSCDHFSSYEAEALYLENKFALVRVANTLIEKEYGIEPQFIGDDNDRVRSHFLTETLLFDPIIDYYLDNVFLENLAIAYKLGDEIAYFYALVYWKCFLKRLYATEVYVSTHVRRVLWLSFLFFCMVNFLNQIPRYLSCLVFIFLLYSFIDLLNNAKNEETMKPIFKAKETMKLTFTSVL